MQALYFILAAIHMAAIVVTGILWVIIDLKPDSGLRPQVCAGASARLNSILSSILLIVTWLRAVFVVGG